MNWNAAGVILNGALAAIALAAGGIAYMQYRTTLAQESVRQSLEFLKMYDSGEVFQARRAIWSAIDQEGRAILVKVDDDKNSGLSSRQATASFSEYVKEMIGRDDLGKSVAELFSFYDQLSSCVTYGICDEAAAYVFFGEDIIYFDGWFRQFVNSLRAGSLRREAGVNYDNFLKKAEHWAKSNRK